MTTPDLQSKHGMTTGLKKILHMCDENDTKNISQTGTSSSKKRKPAAKLTPSVKEVPPTHRSTTANSNKKQKTIKLFLK